MSVGEEAPVSATATTAAAGPADVIEVRLLGSLRVRRRDGTVVTAKEWRTSKARDLLRLLALRAGEPVPTERLLDGLWPDGEAARARASLRTAASQVRKAIGEDCVERRFGSLMLRNTWVDALAFETLAADARRRFSANDLAAGMRIAREAMALYAGEVCADEPYAEWAVGDRERLRKLFQELLAESADAAVALRWLRDAVDLGRRCLEYDPFSERAYRVLMRGHYGLGETEQALRAYETCRTTLVEELGADPSPETQALHLELLSPEPVTPVEVPFVGRRVELSVLREAVRTAFRQGQAVAAVVVGEAGTGKSRLLREALADVAEPVVRVVCGPATGSPASGATAADASQGLARRVLAELAASGAAVHSGDGLVDALREAAPTVVIIEHLHEADAAGLEQLRLVLSSLERPVAILATATLGDLPPGHPLPPVLSGLQAQGRALRLKLGALEADQAGDLAAAVLAGQPCPELVTSLLTASGGNPARIIATVRGWSASGQVVATSRGLAYVPSQVAAEPDDAASALLARAQDLLGAENLRILELAGVLGERLTAGGIAAVLDGCSQERAQAALDLLEDLRVLSGDGHSYRFRDALVRDATYAWLRPSTRRRLHRLVAERAALPPAARMSHWVEAGEPRQAAVAALAAAEEAATAGRDEQVRDHLTRARGLAADLPHLPSERVELLERLGDTCARLFLAGEARAAFEEAEAVARRHGIDAVARLCRKRAGLASPGNVDEALVWYRAALEAGDGPVGDTVRSRAAIAGLVASRSRAEGETSLREAVAAADGSGDVTARVEARVLLSRAVLGPQRRFTEARRVAQEAVALAEPTGDSVLLARAVLADQEPGVLLGNAARAIEPLQRAWQAAVAGGDTAVQAEVGLHLCLASHELGLPQFSRLWPSLSMTARRWRGGSAWRAVAVRVLAERGEVRAAEEHAREFADGADDGGDGQLGAAAVARLHLLGGHPEAAGKVLRAAMERALATGALLGLPELAARLAAVEAPHDRAAASAHLDLAETHLGEAVLGRERSALLLARAAIRAASGQLEAAADVAGAAALAASATGLVFQQADAMLARASYQAGAGNPEQAAATLRAAAAVYDRTGSPAQVRRVADLVDRLALSRPATRSA